MGESEDEAFVLLDRAVDLGINFLDTTDACGGGRSESTLGKWLATKDGTVRDRLLIIRAVPCVPVLCSSIRRMTIPVLP
jgi:aryl-alcohol dehydrogenase-like predicted oxidoreductase